MPASLNPAAPLPWLLADVGGSHARFAWVEAAGQAPQHVRTLAVSEFPSLQAAAQAYLEGLRLQRPGEPARPASAALALATPLGGDAVRFTNSAWSFSRQALQAELGLQRLLLLNDFEALALSLPRLRPQQQRALGQQAVDWQQPLAVVGPGTGLGVAALLPQPGGWRALAGEGGHATLAPFNDEESALLALARRQHPHVSAERLLSGLGLPLLYACVAELQGARAVADVDARWLLERALADDDALASRTLNHFCALLGGFAGSVALTLGARGGVFLGGGLLPRLGERFVQSAFRERFEAKGRYRDYLAAIPTVLISDSLAALDGAAQALSQRA
ncbi:glucokinase [Inhella inkyongensis]|uniref:Glucokinase n=1 Tax=Inhella inkyongensis TaxID=392593 RepID=A0A840SCL0_9BURK|nr:glucokinase [Inhella inkyongensis]MBB5206059.1 glucokinase [Inhella inkyongensis]